MKFGGEKIIFVLVLLGIAFIAVGWSASSDATQGATVSAVATAVPSPTSTPVVPTSTAALAANVSQMGAVSAEGIVRPFVSKNNSVSPPNFTGEVGLVADLETGDTYFEHETLKSWPLASLTKLITAALTRRTIPAATEITLEQSTFDLLGADASRNLSPGEVYTADDLIRAMMTFSSNEAAESLATSTGRSAFIKSMNSLAAEWGMVDTVFADPTGLSSKNRTTGHDLLRLARIIYNDYPDFLAMTRAPRARLTEQSTGAILPVVNINTFAGKPYFLGGKTGYTTQAEGNLLSIFSVEDRPIAIIVLGTADRFGETEKLRTWFIDNYENVK